VGFVLPKGKEKSCSTVTHVYSQKEPEGTRISNEGYIGWNIQQYYGGTHEK
jgi:hypothetical protein